MQVLAVLIIMVVLGAVRGAVSMDKPGKLQQFFELLIEGIDGMLEEIVGHGGRPFIPMLFTLAIYIFLCNILGIIPTLETPTDQVGVTLGLALVSFVYYNYWGIHHHGVLGYIKASFMGPMLAIAPLMFPIEVVSHLARVLSLSVRLMANMIAGRFRTKMADYGRPWAISVPTVTIGSDFRTTYRSDARRVLFPFSTPDGEVFIELILSNAS